VLFFLLVLSGQGLKASYSISQVGLRSVTEIVTINASTLVTLTSRLKNL